MIVKRTTNETMAGSPEFSAFMEDNNLILDLRYADEDMVGYIFSTHGQLVTSRFDPSARTETEVIARGNSEIKVIERLAYILASAKRIGIYHARTLSFKYPKE